MAVYEWAKRYRRFGEAGLKERGARGGGARLPAAVQDKIRELKRAEPRQGAKRISQILRRLFCLQASPETVRRYDDPKKEGHRTMANRIQVTVSNTITPTPPANG